MNLYVLVRRPIPSLRVRECAIEVVRSIPREDAVLCAQGQRAVRRRAKKVP